jgi:hypothetical protein
MLTRILSLTLLGLAIITPREMTFAAAPATLPAGFTLLFNGKDLTGWHGRGHVDPRSVWALSATAQEAQRAKSRPEFEKH